MNKGIDVEIIKDSINWTGHRLTTYVLKYPRYIHSELLTHRVFSKNSASSRAIPIPRMIENIKEDTVMPIWTLNQKGMQGKLANEAIFEAANRMWLNKLVVMESSIQSLINLGIHKQNVNRLLEPWMHIKIILTGTDFENWFALRDHKDAQPEIQNLAKKMRIAMDESKPTYLKPNEWHIPFDDKYKEEELAAYIFKNLMPFGMGADREMEDAMLDLRLKISVANCARISYNNVDGSKSTIEGDLEIYKKLVESEPLHASPSEHQACTPTVEDYNTGHLSVKHTPYELFGEFDPIIDRLPGEKRIYDYNRIQLHTEKGKYFSNLQGWIQYRKILEEIKYKK